MSKKKSSFKKELKAESLEAIKAVGIVAIAAAIIFIILSFSTVHIEADIDLQGEYNIPDFLFKDSEFTLNKATARVEVDVPLILLITSGVPGWGR